jgi:hypothetical protein
MGSEHYPKMAATFEVTLEELFGVQTNAKEPLEQTIQRIQRDLAKLRDAVDEKEKKK